MINIRMKAEEFPKIWIFSSERGLPPDDIFLSQGGKQEKFPDNMDAPCLYMFITVNLYCKFPKEYPIDDKTLASERKIIQGESNLPLPFIIF